MKRPLTLLLLLLSGTACQNEPLGPPDEIGSAPVSARWPGRPPGSQPPKTPVPPELSIVKTAFPAAQSVAAGDPFGFDITVTNNGRGTADRVFLSDILPDFGSGWTVEVAEGEVNVTCITGGLQMLCGVFRQGPSGTEFAGVDMDAGQSYSVRITALNDADDCGTVTNTATVVAENAAEVSDGASIAVICPPRPVLEVVKTGFPDDHPIGVGDSFYYDITVTNNGPGTAFRVFLSDALPDVGSGWTAEVGEGEVNVTCITVGFQMFCGLYQQGPSGTEFAGVDMEPGQSYTVRITPTNDQGDCGTVANTATVVADNADEVSDDGSVTIICPPQ